MSYTYDKLTGMVKTEAEEVAGKEVKKEYAYDSGRNCTSFTISVGGKEMLSLSYEYDGFSRLSKVKLHEGSKVTEVASYTYDEDGSLASAEADGAGLVTDYAYDYAGSLTSMENLTGEGETIASYTASYRLNGQKTSEKETAMIEEGRLKKHMASYTYDSLGRLLTERHTGEDAVTYTYDSHNNRKEMVQGNKTTAYTYDKNDGLLRTDTLNTDTNRDSVALYKYDRNGNQLATVNRHRTESDGTTFDLDTSLGSNRLNKNVVNHYDAMDRLTKTLTKDKKAEYAYDADGLRTAKTVNGKETFYVWDGEQIVMELDGKGKVKKRYVRGTDLVFADEGQGMEKTYYVANPHGDVMQLLDEEGTVIKDYEYDAFGNETHKDKKDDNPYRYSGEYYDKETDSIYLRARYYAPAQGRFLTRDTYTGEEDDSLSLHLYTYCENDGVNQVDPSGHWGLKVHAEITKRALELCNITKDKDGERYKNIIAGSKLPDQARNVVRLSTNSYEPKVLGLVLASRNNKGENGFIADPWHARITNKGIKRLAKKKFTKKSGTKEQRDVLLGCILHSIEDWYAHGGYIMPLKAFKMKFRFFERSGILKVQKGNKKFQMEMEFHSDRLNKKKQKLVPMRKGVHKEYKDNEKRDFDEEEGWSEELTCETNALYQENSRLKNSISDCFDYMNMKGVLK